MYPASIEDLIRRVRPAWYRPPVKAGSIVRPVMRCSSASIDSRGARTPPHLELLGGVESLDVDAYDSVSWRPAAGVNWYVYRHRLKFQFMQRETLNELGVRGAHGHATYVQAQIMF